LKLLVLRVGRPEHGWQGLKTSPSTLCGLKEGRRLDFTVFNRKKPQGRGPGDDWNRDKQERDSRSK